jgi:hypothetical protein
MAGPRTTKDIGSQAAARPNDVTERLRRAIAEARAAADEAEAAGAGSGGVQVYPGSYLIYDAGGAEIGAMFCKKSSSTTNFEYYGITGLVGGVGTPENTIVMKITWCTGYFTDFTAFASHCNTKGYTTHILATCTTGGW